MAIQHSFQLVWQRLPYLDQSKRHIEHAGRLACYGGFHNRAVADLFKGMALAVTSEEPPRPSSCEGDQGNPRLIVTTLVALSQGGGVKRAMLPLPGRRAMDASVSCYRVVQVDVHAPFDKGWLVVRRHVP